MAVNITSLTKNRLSDCDNDDKQPKKSQGFDKKKKLQQSARHGLSRKQNIHSRRSSTLTTCISISPFTFKAMEK